MATKKNLSPEPRVPPLGNGREESLEKKWDEGKGWGGSEGPESQGAFSGQDYGRPHGGDYGDESYDPSYEHEHTPVEAVDPDAGLKVIDDLIETPPTADDATDPPPTTPEAARQAVEEELAEHRRDDDVIQEDIDDLLRTRTEARAVSARVERGEVTLTGTVTDGDDARELLAVVRTVPGVIGVNDELQPVS